MDNIPERRDFERIPIELVVEVAAEDKEGKKHKEKAVLKNISGEGAIFVTQHLERYFLGQHLGINIHLPGTDDVKAHMKGTASVVRIDPMSSSRIGEKSEDT